VRIRALLVLAPLVGASLLVGALFMTAGAAGAVGQVTVSDAKPAPSSAVAVSSTGWFPGRSVVIALTGTNGVLARATADNAGAVHARVAIPADAARKTDVLSVTGTASSGVPQQIVTALSVHADAPVRAPVRPWAAALVLVIIAGGLLLASVSLVSPTSRLAA